VNSGRGHELGQKRDLLEVQTAGKRCLTEYDQHAHKKAQAEAEITALEVR